MIKKIGLILLSGFVLCQMAFYNTFPMVYSDTGTYIDSGFRGRVPSDRPIIYGLFIRHMSLSETLWAVIFVQALIVSYLIYCLVKCYVTRVSQTLFFLSVILILVFCSCLSQKVCTLMPDIFAPVCGLSLILLLIKNELKKGHLVAITFIFIFSCMTHYTHAYIAVLTLLTLLLLLVIKQIDRNYLSWKRCLLLLGITVLSLLLIPTVHYIYRGGFVTSKSKHVFFTGKLIQNGVLIDFLQKKCGTNNYVLCPYKDSLALRDFLWDYNSPLYKTGGWENSAKPYNKMISDLLTSPRHLMMFTYKSIEASAVQFFSFETDVFYENYPLGMGSPPYSAVSENFAHEISDYFGSRQTQGRLDYKELNSRQQVLIYLSFILLIFLLVKRKQINPVFVLLIIICIAFIFYNAVICGSLSIPNSRYQSRVIWLLPLVAGIVLFNCELNPIEKLKDRFLKPSEKKYDN